MHLNHRKFHQQQSKSSLLQRSSSRMQAYSNHLHPRYYLRRKVRSNNSNIISRTRQLLLRTSHRLLHLWKQFLSNHLNSLLLALNYEVNSFKFSARTRRAEPVRERNTKQAICRIQLWFRLQSILLRRQQQQQQQQQTVIKRHEWYIQSWFSAGSHLNGSSNTNNNRFRTFNRISHIFMLLLLKHQWVLQSLAWKAVCHNRITKSVLLARANEAVQLQAHFQVNTKNNYPTCCLRNHSSRMRYSQTCFRRTEIEAIVEINSSTIQRKSSQHKKRIMIIILIPASSIYRIKYPSTICWANSIWFLPPTEWIQFNRNPLQGMLWTSSSSSNFILRESRVFDQHD